MKKILFTDLFRTLICQSEASSKEMYNRRENEINIISRFLNDFLSKNNYVVIITNVPNHERVKPALDYLSEINKKIDKKYKKNIYYYFSGYIELIEYIVYIYERKFDKNSNIYLDKKNDEIYLKKIDGIEGKCVTYKEDAVCDFLKNMILPYRLFALGDNYSDITMLLKVQELGGNASFIDDQLYYEKNTSLLTHDIINNYRKVVTQKIYNDMKFKLDDEYYKTEYKKMLKSKLKDLYNLLYNDEIDLDDLIKKCSISEVYKFFIDINKFYTIDSKKNLSTSEIFREEYTEYNEEIHDKLLKMSMYPSFNTYYNNVLK